MNDLLHKEAFILNLEIILRKILRKMCFHSWHGYTYQMLDCYQSFSHISGLCNPYGNIQVSMVYINNFIREKQSTSKVVL